MAGASFTIRAEGEAALERALAERAAKFGDLSPLMDVITGVLLADTEDNFAGEHAPDGTPWAPTQRQIRGAVGEAGPVKAHKILQDTRRLYLSMAGRHTATTAEIGTNVVYAARHQEGFDGTETVRAHNRTMKSVFGTRLREPIEVAVGSFSRKVKTVARPFIGLSSHATEEILGHVADYAGVDGSGAAA